MDFVGMGIKGDVPRLEPRRPVCVRVSVAKYAIPGVAICAGRLGTRVCAASGSIASVPRQTREGYRLPHNVTSRPSMSSS